MVVDSFGFIGPTFAASALSFLVPLTKPKILSVQVPHAPNAIVTSRADSNFVAITWVMVLVLLFVWAADCYISLKLPDKKFFDYPLHLVIGGSAYLFSLVMSFIKEKM